VYEGDVVVEPRHSSWFAGKAEGLLREFQIARAVADPACVPGAGCPGGSEKFAYFRLHGSPRIYYSEYSSEFLDELAKKILHLPCDAAAWCIFDNTASGFATANALALRDKLKCSELNEIGRGASAASEFQS
jgi:uncharacterized protein YecE (DUF72 family)